MRATCFPAQLVIVLWVTLFFVAACGNSISTVPAIPAPPAAGGGTTPGFNGNEGASGSDEVRDKGQGYWFMIPDRKIRFCAKIDYAKFGITDETILDRLIRSSFKKWITYFEKKKAFRWAARLPFASELEPKDPNKKLTDCAGNEDVVFHFGTTNSRIENALAQPEHENAIALAIPSTTKNVPWRDNNVIWFSNPTRIRENVFRWTLRGTANDYAPIEAELIHEWGHSFNFEHIPGTIMDERLKETILSVIGYSESLRSGFYSQEPNMLEIRVDYLTRIDNTREFIVCESCENEVVSGYFTASTDSNRLNEILYFLTGQSNYYTESEIYNFHPPQAKLILKQNRSTADGGETPSFILQSDLKGTPVSYPIYARALDYNISFAVHGVKENSNDAIYIGTISDVSGGKSVPVVILRNRDKMSPLVIRLLDSRDPNFGPTLFIAESLPVTYSNLTR